MELPLTTAKNKKLFYYSLFLVFSCFCLHIFNQVSNMSYPRSDAADFGEVTQRIWLSYKNGGVIEFIKSFYFDRTWKPIFHPALGALFFLGANGSVLAGIHAYNLFVIAIWLWGVYGMAKLFLEKELALLLVAMVSVQPWMFQITDLYTAESLYGATLFIFLWRLVETYRNSTEKNAFYTGLALAFAFLARPAETFMLAAVPLIVWMIHIYRDGRLGLRDFILSLLEPLLFLTLVIFEYVDWRWQERLSPKILWSAVGLIVFNLGFFKLFRKSLSPFAVVIMTFCSLISIWYFPFAGSLMNWIYEGSLSPVARATGGKNGMSVFIFLNRIFMEIGGPALILLLGIILLTVILLQIFPKDRNKNPNQGFSFWLLLSAVPLQFSLGAMAHNADLRYFVPVVGLIEVLMMIFFLGSFNEKYFNLKYGVGLLYIFLVGIFSIDFQVHPFEEKIFKAWQNPPYGAHQRSLTSDPALEVAEWLNSQIEEKEMHVSVNSLDLNCNHEVPGSMDPWILTIMAREHGWTWNVERLYAFAYPDNEARIAALLRNSDYVLVGPVVGCWDDKRGGNPVSETAAEIVKIMKAGNLEKYHFKKVNEFNARGRDGTSAPIVLLKTLSF